MTGTRENILQSVNGLKKRTAPVFVGRLLFIIISSLLISDYFEGHSAVYGDC